MKAPPPLPPKSKVPAIANANKSTTFVTRNTDIEMTSSGISSKSPSSPRTARSKSMKSGYVNELAQEEEDSVGLTDITIPVKASPKKKPPPPLGHVKAQDSTANNIKIAADDPALFKGRNLLQYALWAHYMSYGAAILCLLLGAFAIFWTKSIDLYQCRLNGQLISSKYIAISSAKCTNAIVLTHNNPNHLAKFICCSASQQSPSPALQGDLILGIFYMCYSIIILLVENTAYGYGLYYRTDNIFYQNRVSPFGLLNVAIGAWGLSLPITMLAGFAVIATGAVQSFAAYRQEAGCADRSRRNGSLIGYMTNYCYATMVSIISFRPSRFFVRISNEDKLSSYVWVFIFVAANAIWFGIVLNTWYGIVSSIRIGLLTGKLLSTGPVASLAGSDSVSHMMRKALRYGPPTNYAAWAKAFGSCLNLNCALLILPVTKLLLNQLNDIGVSFSKTRDKNNYFSKFFASPFTRYVPLSKNIDFHKLCAFAILFHTFGHIFTHYMNLAYADQATMVLFRDYLNPTFPVLKWSGAAFFTGSVATFAMFIIYTAAPQDVRMAKFEIFFGAHHWFAVFYVFVMLHGPNTFFWTFIPVSLYLYERYLQSKRGSHAFVIMKVEYIHPVMAVYFRPKNKKHFQFKEGQYLYLNCPAISKNEWHPFTISSALDDLNNGPRIDIRTGEAVIEVPRPKDWLPLTKKWRKYSHVSDDWRHMKDDEFLEKSDTDYLDFVSCHIKVHGDDDCTSSAESQSLHDTDNNIVDSNSGNTTNSGVMNKLTDTRRPWTRRFKDYLELLQPHPTHSTHSRDNNNNNNNISNSTAHTHLSHFPFYFYEVDSRGDISVGKYLGPDGQPIIRVDGPHSAPSEHYLSYGTTMIVGAGIGLTPCASILNSLIKYRWKKNFNPEILHFYWIVRQSEVESFQWLVHMLTELSYELISGQETNQIEQKFYCEMNIYVTGVDNKKSIPVKPMFKSSRNLVQEANARGFAQPKFTAEELYTKMLNPKIDSKNQILKMTKDASNRLQNVWIWSGRPGWDEIFNEIKLQRQHKDIGVCFCGAPIIGADLKTMCEKYSSVKDDVMFTLHKENF